MKKLQRSVNVLPGNIRIVGHGDREYWTNHIIIPRSWINARIRLLRQQGKQYHDLDWWELMPPDLVPYSYYGGPGRGFAHGASVHTTRRFRMITQSGGLDI